MAELMDSREAYLTILLVAVVFFALLTIVEFAAGYW